MRTLTNNHKHSAGTYWLGSMMFLTCVTFVNGMTRQSAMLLDGGEILGYTLKKGGILVFSWKQEEQKWMQDDIMTWHFIPNI